TRRSSDLTGAGTQDAVLNKAVNGPHNVTAGVSYTLSETNGPSGYSAGSWSCSGGGTQSGASITLGLGDNVTCTINNNDRPGTIVIVKNAKPAQGVFAFDTTGATSGTGTSWLSGASAFSLTGSTASNGNTRT